MTSHAIAPRSGVAFTLSAGQKLTVIDPQGEQVADLLAYSRADVGEVIAETIHEDDTHVNPLGAKGVGEIGIVGMPAAIANAIYHATGTRVRKTPILIEDLL